MMKAEGYLWNEIGKKGEKVLKPTSESGLRPTIGSGVKPKG